VGADNAAGTGDEQTIDLLTDPAGIASDRTLTNPGNVEGMRTITGTTTRSRSA
jgi:hypothetical protein